MKRRGFLSLLGAAGLTPLLPGGMAQAATTGAAAAPMPSYAYALGVFHARTRLHITATDLARRVGVSEAQARQMIQRMITDGHVTSGVLPGQYKATSNILRPRGSGQLARWKAKTEAQANARKGFSPPDLSHVFRPILTMEIGIPTRFA